MGETDAFLQMNEEIQFDYLMSLALATGPDPSLRCPQNEIRGCQSGLWAEVRREGEGFRIRCDSDSMLIRGMALLLADCFERRTAKEAEAAETEALACLFSESNLLLSEERRRGLHRMVQRIMETIKGFGM